MTITEQLKYAADSLPESLAQEVLDFLFFVRERHQKNAMGWPPGLFERTAGKWQGEALKRAPQGELEQRLELE
jgi:hypothetical protein